MKNYRLATVALITALLLSGCGTISNSVDVSSNIVDPDEVCLIPDSSNRKVAYNSVYKGLIQKGFKVTPVSLYEARNCQKIFSCQSVFRWDMALFLYRLDLSLTEGNKVLAKGHYDCGIGGLNFAKFANTEERVNHLLNKMFPLSTPLPSRYTD